MRVILDYDTDSLELLPGETLIGRGLNCQIRFNDPSISRVHVRLLVDEDGAYVEDLGSTNGTLVNGSKVTDQYTVADGDTIEVGYRQIKVNLLSELADDPEADEQTLDDGGQWLGNADSKRGEPRESTEIRYSADQVTIARADDWRYGDDAYHQEPAVHHCPQCRTSVPYTEDTCGTCGYHWPTGRPNSNTQRIRVDEIKRRSEGRVPVELPLLYASENLTFDAVARDISTGGMFISTELLDPIGTRCVLTVLPDGGAAIRIAGQISHVVENETGKKHIIAGMGVRFSNIDERTLRWFASIGVRV